LLTGDRPGWGDRLPVAAAPGGVTACRYGPATGGAVCNGAGRVSVTAAPGALAKRPPRSYLWVTPIRGLCSPLVMSVLITAAAAVAALRAAGHTVTRTTGPDAARRYGCQTLRYVIDGRAVNLGRLRQMAAAEPAPAQPVAVRLNATSEPAPVSLAALAADLGQSLGLSGVGHLPAARRRPVLPGEPTPPPAAPAGGPGPELPTLPTRATPAELRADAEQLETEARQALQVLADIPALAPSGPDIGSMARQLTTRAGELRAVAAARAALPGEPLPPAPPAPPAEPITLPELRAAAAAGRPVSLARLAQALTGETLPPEPPAAVDARLGLPRVATLAQALAGDLATAAPTGDAWAGQPWDPGTPDARARVALQGERVAVLWPIAHALTGAGVTLPGSWATDGPVMAGEWPTDRALAALPIGAIATAAAALAALPPVTRAQARALELCRGQGVAL
jgi:hypothetical protein